MTQVLKVVATSDVEKNTLHKFDHEGQTIMVINLDGNFYALDGKCGHAGGPLCQGEIHAEDKTISCPWHGWEYSITTGECVFDSSLSQKTYPVEVRDGDLYVQLG